MNDIAKIERFCPVCERINKCYEIILPDKEGTIKFSDTELKYLANDVIIVPPTCGYTLSSPASTHLYIERALLSIKDVLVLSDVENNGIRHAARQAEAFLNSDYKNKEAVVAALGNLIVSYLTVKSNDTFPPVVEAVRRDIEKNLSDATYSLEDFIKKLPLNYDYVRKLFKKETGVTPHEYLLKCRMELARGLIVGGMSNKYSLYSVSQIAEACGFAEPLYFSRVFKKYYGAAPSEYGK